MSFKRQEVKIKYLELSFCYNSAVKEHFTQEMAICISNTQGLNLTVAELNIC